MGSSDASARYQENFNDAVTVASSNQNQMLQRVGASVTMVYDGGSTLNAKALPPKEYGGKKIGQENVSGASLESGKAQRIRLNMI